MAVVVGPRLVWVVNRASWKLVMQQVCHTIVFKPATSRPPGATAGSAVDLHHRPDGPWPSSTQFGIRRSVVFTVRSEILPITLVIHGKCILPRTRRINSWTFQPTKWLGCEQRHCLLCPFAIRRYYRSPLDDTPNSRCVLGLGWHLIRAG